LVILVRLHGSIHSKCRLPTARTLLALPLEQQIQCRASGFVQSQIDSAQNNQAPKTIRL
jgi:hypothetical protein